MRRKLRTVLIVLTVLLVLLIVIFYAFRDRYRSVVHDLAQTSVKNSTSELTNAAIAEQITSGGIQYDQIVFFEKDVNGRITALKTNIGEVNHLKTDILQMINSRILSLDSSSIGIPLGSLVLAELFSGRGPVIPVRILSVKNSDAAFFSRFSQAGINQTLHQLVMNIRVDVSILVLGETTSFPVESEIVIAETVIVGDVPDTYIQTTPTE